MAHRPRSYTPMRARRAVHRSPVDTIINIVVIALVVFIGWLGWPMLVREFQARTASAPPQQLAPTLAPMQLQQLQQAAPQTAAEQQTIKQAIPTADTVSPPLLPAQATAAAIVQPVIAADEAQQYSPVDLGWAPLSTPTTMLTDQQFADSQASEEQNFLNNAEQGLTEAQKLVRIHEAEQQAKGQP